MRSDTRVPLLNRRISRRSFAGGTLATGGLLAIGMSRRGTVAAASFGPGDEVVTTTAVNYRDAPGLNSNVLLVLPANQIAVVQDSGTVKDGYTWYLIRIATGGDNPTGYVAGDFLQIDGSQSPNFPVGSQIIVTTDALNVRDRAGLGGSVINVVNSGAIGFVEQTPVAADGYWWILVAFPHLEGWVATDFVQLYSGGGGKFSIGDWVYVNSGPLNFRATPGLNGTILRTLNTDDTGQVTDGPQSASGNTWYQIKIITGEVGWVVQDFLTAGNPPSSGVKIGDTIKVVDGPLNIRSGPGSGYAVIDMAATGATATVVDGPTSANGYTWIKINGNLLAVGWVAFEFCAVV